MSLLSLLLPPRCPYCSKPIGGGGTECEACRMALSGGSLCRSFDSGEVCVAPFSYQGQVREAIMALKFFKRRFNAKSLARCMAQTVGKYYELSEIPCVTFVPMHRDQKRIRSYDHAELLAKELARCLKKPCGALLYKVRHNQAQHELSREDRIHNVAGVYDLVSSKRLVRCTILLVDDICTTGRTLSECSKVLLRGGASRVYCVTAALSGEFS